MKTIGLVGGLSWESTAAYYEVINKGVNARLGGLSSAQLALVSLDFGQLMALHDAEQWSEVASILTDAARKVEAAGADLLLICSGTFHRVYDEVAAAVKVPVVHLADVLAAECKAKGVTTVGFIGTSFMMKDLFFLERLASHGLDVDLPDEAHHDTFDAVIYDELVHRKINPSSRRRIVGIIDELSDAGAKAVIFGATELSALVRPEDLEIEILDPVTVHSAAALAAAL